MSETDKTVLHIHGTLADKKIVLGVNDERQITIFCQIALK